MKNLIYTLFCFLLLLSYTLSGQIEKPNFEVHTQGLLDIDDTPFWFQSNTSGAVEEGTNYVFNVKGAINYKLSENAILKLKASAFVHDGANDTFERDELYVEFENKWLTLTLGSKQVQDKFRGLGVVRDNFVLSGNARAFPGIIAQANKPIQLSQKLSVDWAIAHYELNDDRFVDGTLVHHKRFGINWIPNSRNRFYAGIEHYAQWGGTSPTEGSQPTGIDDFVDIFFARGGNEEASMSDQGNALGNSLGLYKFEYIHAVSYTHLTLPTKA